MGWREEEKVNGEEGRAEGGENKPASLGGKGYESVPEYFTGGKPGKRDVFRQDRVGRWVGCQGPTGAHPE